MLVVVLAVAMATVTPTVWQSTLRRIRRAYQQYGEKPRRAEEKPAQRHVSTGWPEGQRQVPPEPRQSGVVRAGITSGRQQPTSGGNNSGKGKGSNSHRLRQENIIQKAPPVM